MATSLETEDTDNNSTNVSTNLDNTQEMKWRILLGRGPQRTARSSGKGSGCRHQITLRVETITEKSVQNTDRPKEHNIVTIYESYSR